MQQDNFIVQPSNVELMADTAFIPSQQTSQLAAAGTGGAWDFLIKKNEADRRFKAEQDVANQRSLAAQATASAAQAKAAKAEEARLRKEDKVFKAKSIVMQRENPDMDADTVAAYITSGIKVSAKEYDFKKVVDARGNAYVVAVNKNNPNDIVKKKIGESAVVDSTNSGSGSGRGGGSGNGTGTPPKNFLHSKDAQTTLRKAVSNFYPQKRIDKGYAIETIPRTKEQLADIAKVSSIAKNISEQSGIAGNWGSMDTLTQLAFDIKNGGMTIEEASQIYNKEYLKAKYNTTAIPLVLQNAGDVEKPMTSEAMVNKAIADADGENMVNKAVTNAKSAVDRGQTPPSVINFPNQPDGVYPTEIKGRYAIIRDGMWRGWDYR